MGAKERIVEIYEQHIALAINCTDGGRVFRKTVREQLMAETGCNDSAASTHYNYAKLAREATHGPIAGLGRAPVPKGARKVSNKAKPEDLQPDNECFAVIEILTQDGNQVVGRCQAFAMQGDASETFDGKVTGWPNSHWVLIQGLGPLHGEAYKLDADEKEIKSYDPAAIAAAAAAKAKEVAETA
jgi:hypothetical protein